MLEGKKSRPYALLVFGAPCSGKTTFSEKFAQKYDLVYFNLEELKENGNLSRKAILAVVKQLTKTRRNLILEGEVSTEKERRELSILLRKSNYNPSLIWIQTDVATIRSRLKARYKTVGTAKNIYASKIAELEAPNDKEEAIILSGKHTFETQARHALTGLSK